MSDLATNTLRLARVTHVSPETNSFGCIYLDTGDYGRGVQLSSPYAGSDFGVSGMPALDVEGYDENMTDDPNVRAVVAVIAQIQGMPIALGFLYPKVSEMAMVEKGRLVERHTSDAYRSVSPSGDMDTVHPSGAYLRIGSGDSPDALEGRDAAKRWRVKRNTGGSATVTLGNPGGGGTSVKLKPDGGVEVSGAVRVDVRSAGVVEIDGAEKVTAKSGASSVTISPGGLVTVAGATEIALDAPVTRVTGTLILGSGRAESPGPITIASAVAVTTEAPQIVDQASGAIVQRAPSVTTDAAEHVTTGVHRDSIGGHRS